jgi:Ulp1 family protease
MFIHIYTAKKQNKEFNAEDWKCLVASNIPKQRNGFDCGACVLAYIDGVALGTPSPLLFGENAADNQPFLNNKRFSVLMSILKSIK